MDPRILKLYDEYTHAPLPRRIFLERLAGLCGSTAAAMAFLPLLDNNYAHAATVSVDDARLNASRISYKGATGDVGAYLVLPKDGPPKRPGVVVIHENRGLTPYIQDVTRRIALLGYTALGIDLLSPVGGTPADEDQGRQRFGTLDQGRALSDALAAVAYLKSRSDATGRVGAIGFCFGGTMVNRMAVASADLDAGVVFYGRQPAAADVGRIKAKMQIHYAGNDPGVNAGMAEYEAQLMSHGIAYEQYVYDGAQHAFHNDTGAARYDKAAAELAWSRTVAFLKSAFA